ncbi:LysM peptidoglycan-binding domain-containing protein [Thermohalobacter berrensis]|uniref:Spore gernimation protein n=1 Tax=Thermohalobacter berrensis TaxID=99594 RepID=A0A419SWA5_9FIRM|nr:LysM peptidoglycan-binding domain-containing protein [Thermohalobacter berrensis]RKD29502.1 spore gernimation protein [Thermohalobacter berrensis]
MIIHVVEPGQTLWEIATYYRVSLGEIINVNELPNPNRLVVGQSLIIPTEDVIHTVRPDESIWQIAQLYRTTVETIIEANNIVNPNYIYPGLRLYIPAPRHQVQPGETLWEIARRYGVSLQTLLKINNIENPNLIYPGTILVIPLRPRPVIDVNGYIYEFGEEAVPIVRKDGEHLTYLSPFAYLVTENGDLAPIDDVPAIIAAYEENVVPMMSITNFTATELGENLAHIILANPQIQERLLTNIINVMREKGYLGLNIDFENVLPDDRELYNQFIQRAVDRLHREDFFVSTALAPKTSPEQRGLLYEAHDYEAHGRIADFVILMTYEWGYRLGPPQSISPLNQIRRVLDYAVSVIPRNKIFFGFQIYARDWLLPHVQGQEAETFSIQEAILRAVENGATIMYDSVSQSPFYRYRDEQGRLHEVWFEDARSAQAKFDTVKEYGLRGISYWVLGYPFPQNWALLEDNFIIRKRV